MINWIERWFHDGTSYLARKALHWVHVALHAIAGIVTGIVGNVRLAWQDLQHAVWYAFEQATYGAELTYHAIWWLVNRGIPFVYRYIIAHVKYLESAIAKAATLALHDAIALFDQAEKYTREFTAWFHANIVAPIDNSLHNAWHWINVHGEYAWKLVTHPDRLADLIVAHFAGAIMRASDGVAITIGTTILHILTKQLGRVARIAEQIISSAL